MNSFDIEGVWSDCDTDERMKFNVNKLLYCIAPAVLTTFKRHVHHVSRDLRKLKLTSLPGQSIQSWKQNWNHYVFIDREKKTQKSILSCQIKYQNLPMNQWWCFSELFDVG